MCDYKEASIVKHLDEEKSLIKFIIIQNLIVLNNHTFHWIKTVYMFNDFEKIIVCEMGESLQAVF